MADRYWVGGTGSWDATAGTKWATTSGGTGGASVPTSADNVFFDANSGAVTVTISALASCRNLNFTGFTGTLSGSQTLVVYGSFTLVSGMTFSHSGTLQFENGVGGAVQSINTAGKTLSTNTITFGNNSSNGNYELASAITANSASFIVTRGTFTTNNYNVTASSLSSSNSNTRTINLGSSTVTLSGNPFINITTNTNLTFNAGTSNIVATGSSATLQAGTDSGAGLTFYNVSFTNAAVIPQIRAINTFNNLSIVGRTSAGINNVIVFADQTINGTLTLSAGTNATMRTFVRSSAIGTTRTLTCAAVDTLQDIDFRDITIAGAAAPVSGTRLGDCKGNSGITFDAPKTVYYRGVGSGNWNTSTNWSFTSGGTGDVTAFPLAQDTAFFPAASYPSSGSTVTITASYNIGTIDMSARTSNTMTLATGTQTPAIYGNWTNGTGTTLTGTSTLTFAGRGSQTITSAGKTFTQGFVINTPSGAVTLQDAFITSMAIAGAIDITQGTFDANGYNVTSQGVSSSSTFSRTAAIGSGTWTLTGSSTVWFNSGTTSALTVTGTGTISLTSASAKTFAGGGIQTYPTLNQGGAGTLTVTGSNKFAGLTNTAIGRIQFTGGTTNEFSSFTISGALGNLLPLGSTNTTQAILKKPSAWNMGVLSIDAGNNTGLNFLSNDGTMEYLSVSYINGQVVAPPVSATGNFLMFFN
jgi:hypothetical protein